MSSYHSSFTYRNINSAKDKGLIIAAFEPDNGLKDTFLSMEPIQEDSYDGTKKNDYGAKYNATADITITVVKKDQSDFSLQEVRSNLKWLTGARVNSWMDMYIGDEIVYSFIGRVTNVQQYKLDARTVALTITFSSIAPWAFSAEQHFEHSFGQSMYVDDDHILHLSKDTANIFEINDQGTLYAGQINLNAAFTFLQDGVVYISNEAIITVNNKSDDIDSYINLDMKLINNDCEYLSIKNMTLGEETLIQDMSKNEVVQLSARQFIMSDIPNKIFGDNFNFVWPRLCSGYNEISICGGGSGKVEFSYRYPMKIGDCAIDTETYSCDMICEDTQDENSKCPCINTIDEQELNDMLNKTLGHVSDDETGEVHVSWDIITDTPTTIEGYGITDAYTMKEIDEKTTNVNIDETELSNMLGETFG